MLKWQEVQLQLWNLLVWNIQMQKEKGPLLNTGPTTQNTCKKNKTQKKNLMVEIGRYLMM